MLGSIRQPLAECYPPKAGVLTFCRNNKNNSKIGKLYLLFRSIFSGLLSPFPAHAWTGKVVGVTDGDTIKVLQDREQVKIRLYGIDTPEKAQAFGNKAKKFTSSLVAGKIVDIESVTKDRYGRTVALVMVAGKNVNEEIVRAGYAWVYRKYCKKSFCGGWYDLESTAQNNRRGLWADKNATPPWEWRHGKKSVANRDTSGALHGNVKSHVFHKPGCKVYDCKSCTKKFKHRDSAILAGYRPCGMCRP